MKGMMKKINVKTMISATILSVLLVGCGGSTVDTLINVAEKNKRSTFTFINATHEMASFYIQPKHISKSIYSSKHEVANISEGDISEPYTYQWNENFSRSVFASIDSVSQTKKYQVNFTIENEKSYWGIAWLDNNEYSMSIVKLSSNPSSDGYAIRFFSMSGQDISVGDSTSPLVTAYKGEATSTFTFDNCADIEIINGNLANFCQIANAGESYIAIILANGEVIFAQE